MVEPGERGDARSWHAGSAEEALERLATQREGLSFAEAEKRLATHGLNALPTAKSRGAFRRFVAQFHDVLIYVLLGSALVTALLGHVVDTTVILLVVLINAVIGFVQEGRAEKALDAIKGMIEPNASVLRDGRRSLIRAEEVAPGDVVLLEAGDRVPADLRLVRARNLKIEEAILTGESAAVDKGVAPVEAAASLGDRTCMAYSGTFVVAGQGLGVAVATGVSTELGRISALLREVEPLTTPLVRQMGRFARRLTVVILAISAVVFVVAITLRSYTWPDAFLAVVALAVAAIPEGLPAVMTITLAIGVQRMAARNAIIRRLPAVETLGSVSVICSDKTGTLTRNEMMAQAAVTAIGSVEATGEGYEPKGALWRDGRELDLAENPAMRELAHAAQLCNDAVLRQAGSGWIVDGDPMEGALASFAAKAGYEAESLRRQFPRADEIPFDSRHRFMATLHHRHENGPVAYVKGAPERVLGMCAAQHGAKGAEPVDHAFWTTTIETLARQGQRVLALAAKDMPQGVQELAFPDVESGLVLLGVVGLIDPPRAEAIMAVEDCRSAGIEVKMITGDHAATATAVAQRLGLPRHDAVITGESLEPMNDEELVRAAREMTVFARTSPEHKLRLVEALQSQGATVAMTGDGVNDAPALKRADVGVAMGRKGTEAAKEAAEMVLADDNFASIVAAVREGRTVYDNLKKVIGWALPTNGGQAAAIAIAIPLGLPLPVTPLDVLWVNMISAVALGLTLAFDPTEPDAMRRPPRDPDEPLLSGFLAWRVLFVSLLFVIGAFGMFFWAQRRGLPIEAARTIVVNTIVVMEIFYLFNVRIQDAAAFALGSIATRAVLIGVGAITLAQILFTYAPFMQAVFDTKAVSLRDGAAMIGVGAALFVVIELEKLAQRFALGPAGVEAGASRGGGWRRRAVGVAAACVAAGFGWLAWTAYRALPPVGEEASARVVTTMGVVRATSSEPIVAAASGVVAALSCERGEEVTAGQSCARIDPASYRAQVERAKSVLAGSIAKSETSELRLSRAKAAFERAGAGAKRGAVSRRAVAKSRAALERATARAERDGAELSDRRAALRAAEAALANTDIRSPVAGMIVSRDAKIGDRVEAGGAALFRVAPDLAAVRVEAAVTAEDVGRVHVGDEARFTVSALPDRRFAGEVIAVGEAREGEGAEVVIRAANPDLALRPDMTANIRILVDRRADAHGAANAGAAWAGLLYRFE